MISIFVAFVIIMFLLVVATAIVAGAVTLIFFSKQKEYFMEIFKPGLLSGAIGLILLFIISYLVAGNFDNSFSEIFLLIPLSSICIGVFVGTEKALELRRGGSDD